MKRKSKQFCKMRGAAFGSLFFFWGCSQNCGACPGCLSIYNVYYTLHHVRILHNTVFYFRKQCIYCHKYPASSAPVIARTRFPLVRASPKTREPHEGGACKGEIFSQCLVMCLCGFLWLFGYAGGYFFACDAKRRYGAKFKAI